ncbi:ribonuclease H-like domain-containing protein, partial [Tanacetum coccineum]
VGQQDNGFAGGNKLAFVELFECLPSIVRMAISWKYMLLFTAGGIPQKLPTPLAHLRGLFWAVCFMAQDELSALFCLIKSSPNLELIVIKLLVKLLGLLGLSDHSNLSSSNTNASKSNFVSHDNPTVYHTSIGSGPHNYVPTVPSPGPIPYYTLPAQPQGPIALHVQYVGSAHPHVASQMVIPAKQPMYPSGPFQTFTTPTSGYARQKTTLPHAFAAGTLHDPTTNAWNMDTGDLYPVTSPSPISHAFLVSHLVNTRGINVLDTQGLGKHVKLPFVSSDTVISSYFDIIHSDVWTSPISSISEDTFDLHPTLPNPAFTTPTIGQTDPLPHQQHLTEPAAQQSPTAAPPIYASPSTAQIYSPVQQPSPIAQHIPIQLQFSPTIVSHQTIIVLDQHAPAIIQNPLVNPNPDSVHLMVTRFRVGTNRLTERLNLHVSSVSPLPKSYRDAFNDPKWKNAMRDEYTALIKNKTWTLVPRPPDTNIVRCMWLFCHKYLANGTLSHYKARLVANGSTQLEGVDVDETFSPVVKPGTIRTVLSLAASRHWPIHQLDVKNAFLHGDLSKTVYMHQPLGFRDSASSEGLLQQIIGSLHQEFAMTDLGPLNYFLGISVTRDFSGLFLSQKKYAIEILEKAHMVSCNPSRTLVDTESKLGVDGDPISDPTLYRSLEGSLQYLTFTRPDISYAVQQVCLHMHDPREPHLSSLKRILRLVIPRLGDRLQEAEYRGVANVVAETCWLKNLLHALHTPLSSAMLVYCDNVSVVYLSSNPVQHQRTKHIEIDIYFVRDLVATGQVRVLHVPSRYQFADIFTKGLPSALFVEFRTSLSVRCPPAPTVGEC